MNVWNHGIYLKGQEQEMSKEIKTVRFYSARSTHSSFTRHEFFSQMIKRRNLTNVTFDF